MRDGPRLDLHVHSGYSPDSRLTLDQIFAQLPYAGIRGFALTDHNSVAGHRALEEARAAHPTFLVVPGAELSTQEGHLLAYGIRELPPRRLPVVEAAEWVRAHGGEPVLAHPYRLAHGVGRRVAEYAPVRAVEVRNGHNSVLANAKAELLAARRHLVATGGSDGHTVPDLGQAYTQFMDAVDGTDDLLEAIRRGRVEAGGRSLGWSGRVRLGLGTGARFLARGLRPI
jgi:predicted metal-dependent phosphoesterase TrpH